MTTTIIDPALPLHLFTVEDYHRMSKAGLFEGERVELIYGKVIDTSPSKSTHASMIVNWSSIGNLLTRAIPVFGFCGQEIPWKMRLWEVWQ